MKAQLRILTGSRAGHTEVFSKPYIGIGRHPASDLRFDPDRDLDVSARHAAILQRDRHWYVRDLGSRNKTLVNGHTITDETRLDDTDQIRFGPHGPALEFRLVPDGSPDGVLAEAQAPAAANLAATFGGAERRHSTTERIRIEVGRQTKKLRTVVVALFVTLLVAAAAFWFESRRQAAQREREVAALEARTDSILRASDAAVRALRGQVAGLADALRRSQSEVERLRDNLATARQAGNATEVAELRRRLADATQELSYQQAAAAVDYGRIVENNEQAVAIVRVEFGPGEVRTGTAFAVEPDGTMLTNRHTVAGPEGDRPYRRMGVQFADSDQFFPARLVAVASEVDLAVIKTDIRGGVPTVQGLNRRADTVGPGDPVALIGFPLGTDLPMSEGRTLPRARTSFHAGTVSKVLPDLLQIDSYGARGSSGTPIFDGNGEVVGILYGGQPGSEGRIVYAVPVAYALDLLAQEATGRSDR